MSDVVNADTVEFYRGRQDHGGGVPVTVRSMPAGLATEDSYTQREPLLGSHKTTRAGHSRIGGRHQHHPPARPLGPYKQLALRDPDSGISCLAGQRGTTEELRFEVLDSDRVMIGDHSPRPHTSSMTVLAGGLLVQPRRFAPSHLVSPTGGVATWATPTSHLPLRSREFGGAPPPIPEVGQVMGRAGRRRGRSEAPVDTDSAGRGRRVLDRAAHHERRVPVAEGVAVDADRGRRRGQFPRPHHRDRDAFGQGQPAVGDSEPACGVFQRRQRLLAGLPDRSTTCLHRERVVQGARVVPQGLLLGDLRSFAQPGGARAGSGQHFRQSGEGWFVALALLVDRFIPEESATVPFGFQCAYRLRAGAQAVGVAHDLIHTDNCIAVGYISFRWRESGRTARSSPATRSPKSTGGSGRSRSDPPRVLGGEFPSSTSRMSTSRTNSYFVDAVGGATLER